MRVLERRPMVDMILSNPPLMILDDDRDILDFDGFEAIWTDDYL